MKVLWVSHTAQRGGAELVLEEGARALGGAGVETVVALPGDGPLKTMLEQSGIQTVYSYLPWWVSLGGPGPYIAELRGFVSSVRQMMKVIRSVSPDVVLTNTLTIPSPALAAKLTGIPHVWMIQEFLDSDHGLYFHLGRGLSLRYVNMLSTKVAVASQAVLSAFEGELGEGKIEIVRYAVDFTESGNPVARPLEDAFRLVLVGAKYPAKGQEIAVRAVAELKSRGRLASLEMVGPSRDGYDGYLRELCRELAVDERVFQIEFTEDPFAYSSSADAVLVCSKSEAFGRVTVEGMKLGKPVIAASSGAGAELVRDGVTGCLYETFNHVQLADKIQMLMDNPALAENLGKDALKWSRDNFTLQKYGTALRSLCEKAMASKV